MKDEPALAAEQIRSNAAITRSLAKAIAERSGADARRDLHPRLAAATFVAVVHAALDESPRGSSLHATLTEALRPGERTGPPDEPGRACPEPPAGRGTAPPEVRPAHGGVLLRPFWPALMSTPSQTNADAEVVT